MAAVQDARQRRFFWRDLNTGGGGSTDVLHVSTVCQHSDELKIHVPSETQSLSVQFQRAQEEAWVPAGCQDSGQPAS